MFQKTTEIGIKNFFPILCESSIVREINKCKHIFHLSCADRWFENNIKCPLCRQDIRVEIVN